MNWEAIGAIGELLGALGVLATLIYVGVQVRQNTRMMKATIRQGLATASIDTVIRYASHAAVFAKMQQASPMPQWDSAAEEMEGEWLCTSAFRSWEGYAWQHGEGLLDDSEWTGLVEDMRFRATFPYYVKQWRQTRERYSTRLRAIVDPLFGISD